MNHPLPVGTRVKYDSSACGCNNRSSEGIITKVETSYGGLIVYEIDNGKRIPYRRIKKVL